MVYMMLKPTRSKSAIESIAHVPISCFKMIVLQYNISLAYTVHENGP